MSVYQLSTREVYQTYIADGTEPAAILQTGRTELATRLRVEEELKEEDAYFAADQIMAYAQQLQDQLQGEAPS
ncbi:MAG: hypothetical protein KDE19_05485 [Caldilineaceae bacterium]|nr:hypothetical protein [Caldilineaceae bacterium]